MFYSLLLVACRCACNLLLQGLGAWVYEQSSVSYFEPLGGCIRLQMSTVDHYPLLVWGDWGMIAPVGQLEHQLGLAVGAQLPGVAVGGSWALRGIALTGCWVRPLGACACYSTPMWPHGPLPQREQQNWGTQAVTQACTSTWGQMHQVAFDSHKLYSFCICVDSQSQLLFVYLLEFTYF